MKYFLLFLVAIIVPGKLNSQSMPVIKQGFDSLMAKIPGKGGERFTQVLRNNSVSLFLYAPRDKDLQQPHNRDEFYIVAKGKGVFWCDGTSSTFLEGDLLFAPAGKEHRFENFSNDLVVWVVFYGDKQGVVDNKEIVSRYLLAINKHAVGEIISLQSTDHVLIDAHGNELTGTDMLVRAWTDYFQLFPDYRIEVSSVSEVQDEVFVFGYASAGLTRQPSKHWKLPVAIRAHVKDGKVSGWQIYADTKIPFDLLSKP
jgi:mannose-6-phosphate isomerase-like protein (cupin superfamily)